MSVIGGVGCQLAEFFRIWRTGRSMKFFDGSQADFVPTKLKSGFGRFEFLWLQCVTVSDGE